MKVLNKEEIDLIGGSEYCMDAIKSGGTNWVADLGCAIELVAAIPSVAAAVDYVTSKLPDYIDTGTSCQSTTGWVNEVANDIGELFCVDWNADGACGGSGQKPDYTNMAY